jgi:hypothetical protein
MHASAQSTADANKAFCKVVSSISKKEKIGRFKKGLYI